MSGLKFVRLLDGEVFKLITLRSLLVPSLSASLIFLGCSLILIPIGVSRLTTVQ